MAPLAVFVVTGGCGFLGKHIVNQLLEKKGVQEVRVFDLVTNHKWDDARVKVIAGDLRDSAQVSKVVAGSDCVMHVASANPLSKNKKLLWDVNVLGTKNVIDACVEHGVTRLVFTSSASVIYDGKDQKAGDETLSYPEKYRDAYCESKAEAERILLKANGYATKAGASKPLLTVSLRPHGIFGEYDPLLVPNVVEQARKGKIKWIIGDGGNVVDFTYAGNVAHAHIVAADALVPGAALCGQCYFITNEEPVRFWDFLGRISGGLGYEKPRLKIPYSVMLVIGWLVDFFVMILSPCVTLRPVLTLSKVQLAGTHHYYSSAKAKRDFGYVPPVKLDEALRRTLVFFSDLKKK
eukprot:tig00000215_g18656.t1